MLGAFVFFVLVPASIGFPMGWFQAGTGRYMSTGASCGMWISQWLISWWLAELLLRVGGKLFAPWKLPFPVLLLIAAAGTILLSRFYSPALIFFFVDLGGGSLPEQFSQIRRNLTDGEYLRGLLLSAAYAPYWMVLRFFYERWGRPRDSVTQPAELQAPIEAAPVVPSPLPARLTTELRKTGLENMVDVIALQAEDHYVRLHTAEGSRLILYRFTDILADLRHEIGVQVHRSFWVRPGAIREVRREGGAMRLTLINGMTVPVSQKNEALLDYFLEREGRTPQAR